MFARTAFQLQHPASSSCLLDSWMLAMFSACLQFHLRTKNPCKNFFNSFSDWCFCLPRHSWFASQALTPSPIESCMKGSVLVEIRWLSRFLTKDCCHSFLSEHWKTCAWASSVPQWMNFSSWGSSILAHFVILFEVGSHLQQSLATATESWIRCLR